MVNFKEVVGLNPKYRPLYLYICPKNGRQKEADKVEIAEYSAVVFCLPIRRAILLSKNLTKQPLES